MRENYSLSGPMHVPEYFKLLCHMQALDMSDCVLLNLLLNELGESDKMGGMPSLWNSVKQNQDC